MRENYPRPPLRTLLLNLIGVGVATAAVIGFDRATHDDVLTAVVVFVGCSAYVGWYFWHNRQF